MKLNPIKYSTTIRDISNYKDDVLIFDKKSSIPYYSSKRDTKSIAFKGLSHDKFDNTSPDTEEENGFLSKICSFFSRINRKRKSKKILKEMQTKYEKRINPPEFHPGKEPLPILEKYVNPIKETVKSLVSKCSCIVYSDKDIDSTEVFTRNLRTFINAGCVRHLGLKEHKPFVRINLADYIENSQNANANITKDIQSQLEGKEQPILFVSGIRAFFDTIDRPHDFAASSIFKKYPTIFFVEQGYEILNHEEAMNLKLGRETREERLQHENSFFDEWKYKQTLSKLTFLRSMPKVELPSLNSDDVYIYLTNDRVKKICSQTESI